jgi:ABC-2 type transport system permease protein
VLGTIMGFRPGGGFLGVLAAVGLVLLFAFAMSWLWIIIGMLVRTPESVMTTSFVFLMPLTFASNIFVKLDTMPGWLQTVVGNNPVTFLADAARKLMHGDPAGPEVLRVLIATAVVLAIAAPIAIRLYRKER